MENSFIGAYNVASYLRSSTPVNTYVVISLFHIENL